MMNLRKQCVRAKSKSAAGWRQLQGGPQRSPRPASASSGRSAARPRPLNRSVDLEFRGRRMITSIRYSTVHFAGAIVWALLVLLGTSGCKSTPVSPCWMGFRVLLQSGMTVSDTASARAAFESYVALVDTTDVEYPDHSYSWSFLSAAKGPVSGGVQFWKIWHLSRSSADDPGRDNQTVYVDEHGAVVQPLGCI